MPKSSQRSSGGAASSRGVISRPTRALGFRRDAAFVVVSAECHEPGVEPSGCHARRHRLRRLEVVTGRDLAHPAQAAEVMVALEAARVLVLRSS